MNTIHALTMDESDSGTTAYWDCYCGKTHEKEFHGNFAEYVEYGSGNQEFRVVPFPTFVHICECGTESTIEFDYSGQIEKMIEDAEYRRYA